MPIQTLLHKTNLTKDDIIRLLNAVDDDEKMLFDFSGKIKLQNVGNTVYLRGLIELSNICEKDCYYCGIRKSNINVKRYNISEARCTLNWPSSMRLKIFRLGFSLSLSLSKSKSLSVGVTVTP